MLINPKKTQISGGSLYIKDGFSVVADNSLDIAFLAEKLKRAHSYLDGAVACEKIEFIMPIPKQVINDCPKMSDSDAFYIELGASSRIYSNNALGANYAVSYLTANKKILHEACVFDYPYKPVRGYKMFVPPEKDFDAVTNRILDMLIDFRYNTLVLEIGGAMEYISHPKINTEWKKLCTDVCEYSGKGDDISLGKLYPWPKNVIHVDNGGGGYVSQDKMRQFVSECKKHGIKIIPEVPSLSHCDYLVRAYPEIRERFEDTDYPDCYCPENPKTYEILFDILDEICEIFEPEYVHIGHDELFSIALCEMCKNKKPEELFVGDVIKISNYLKSKGIKTMMWADMLSNGCERLGGAGRSVPGNPQYVPAMYSIRNMLPKDIVMVDWWYEADKNHINVLEDCGYTVVFGNLSMHSFTDWQRFEKSCVIGGVVSNWGSLKKEYMQLNAQNFDVIYNSHVFWNGDTDENNKEKRLAEVMEQAYQYFNADSEDSFEILMTSDKQFDISAFYDGNFFEDEKYTLGKIVFDLTNGETKECAVIYGLNLMSSAENTKKFTKLCGGALPVIRDEKILYKSRFYGGFSKDKIKKCRFVKTLDDEISFSFEIV